MTFEIRSKWRIIAGARYARAMLDAMCYINSFSIKIFQMALEINVKVFKTLSAAVLTLSVPNQIVNLGWYWLFTKYCIFFALKQLFCQCLNATHIWVCTYEKSEQLNWKLGHSSAMKLLLRFARATQYACMQPIFITCKVLL